MRIIYSLGISSLVKMAATDDGFDEMKHTGWIGLIG